MTRTLKLLLLAAIALAPGCRTTGWPWARQTVSAPVLFNGNPTRDEVLLALRSNSDRIRTLQAQGGSVSVPGAPAISADVALERPGRFRFRAGSTLFGAQVDAGVNDEMFWFWTAQAPTPSVFYARLDQLAASPVRNQLSIDPRWLVDALGIVQIDPNQPIDGPVAAGVDRVELKTKLVTPAGSFTRLLYVHNRYGWLVEQHLQDDRGRLVVSSRLSQHQFYPLDNVSLPQRIEVQAPDSQLRFQLDVARWGVNQPIAGGEVFAFPREQLAAYPLVDIAAPGFTPPGYNGPPQYTPSPAPTGGMPSALQYRGESMLR